MLASADGSDGAAFLALTAATAQALLITVVLRQQRYGATNLTHCGTTAGVQPPVPQRVPHAVGGHLLPGVPLLPQQRGPRIVLQRVLIGRGPVDLPHLWPHRLRALPRRACDESLEGDRPLLRPGAGDAAGTVYFVICCFRLSAPCCCCAASAGSSADTALSHSCSMATRATKAGLLCCPEHDDEHNRN